MHVSVYRRIYIKLKTFLSKCIQNLDRIIDFITVTGVAIRFHFGLNSGPDITVIGF